MVLEVEKSENKHGVEQGSPCCIVPWRMEGGRQAIRKCFYNKPTPVIGHRHTHEGCTLMEQRIGVNDHVPIQWLWTSTFWTPGKQRYDYL